MPVFISHKDKDTAAAVSIKTKLESHQIICYLDVFDEKIAYGNITDRITSAMEKCTHLIAVMSDATKDSWWVPFEIGEATFGYRRICSYDLGCTFSFPEYLSKWPKMSSSRHLEFFVTQYKIDNGTAKNLRKDSVDYPSLTRSEFNKFHADLKENIRRGY
jgi:hypothetical protein